MINPAIESLISYTSKSTARAAEQDPEIVNLSIGEPDFGPPPFAVERLAEVLDPRRFVADLKRYEASRGAPELRTAIAQYYARHHGLAIDPDTEILVSHGGVGALTIAMLAGSAEGDEIAIPEPSYMLYERQVRSLGRIPLRVPRDANDGFRYDLARIASAVGPRTRMLVINSPENPTGYVCTDEELRGLVELCRERRMWLVHDEVYDQHTFGRRHRPARSYANADDPVLAVNSFSKKFGVPGLRIGWLVAPPRFAAAASKVHDYCYLAVSRTAEAFGALMLGDPASDAWFEEIRRTLDARFDLMVAGLGNVEGVEVTRLDGGLFVFPRVRKLAARLGLGGDDAGAAVAKWLLDELKIASVPGGVYGDTCRDYVRFVVCVEPERLRTAVERLAVAAKRTPQPVR